MREFIAKHGGHLVALLIFFGIASFFLWSFINHTGIFYAPYKLKSDPTFTMSLPGKPDSFAHTYGTAAAPTIQTYYLYTDKNQDTGSHDSFMLVKISNGGNVDPTGLQKYFDNSVAEHLNELEPAGYQEQVLNQNTDQFDGYPAIEADLKLQNIDVTKTERFILVGNDIYWLQASAPDANLSNYFNRYASTLHLTLGTAFSQQ